MDYQGNAKKDKEAKIKPVKTIQPVVTTPVVIKKKSLGRKIKDIFIEADFRNVIKGVIADVLIPAARNTIVDASTKGIERMIYGESAVRRRGFTGSRFSYQTPVSRPSREYSARYAPPVERGPRTSRSGRDDVIIASKEEAELILERMNDVIDQFEIVTVLDFYELAGLPTNPNDNKWGWDYLGDTKVLQTRDGYLIDLPPAVYIT